MKVSVPAEKPTTNKRKLRILFLIIPLSDKLRLYALNPVAKVWRFDRCFWKSIESVKNVFLGLGSNVC